MHDGLSCIKNLRGGGKVSLVKEPHWCILDYRRPTAMSKKSTTAWTVEVIIGNGTFYDPSRPSVGWFVGNFWLVGRWSVCHNFIGALVIRHFQSFFSILGCSLNIVCFPKNVIIFQNSVRTAGPSIIAWSQAYPHWRQGRLRKAKYKKWYRRVQNTFI